MAVLNERGLKAFYKQVKLWVLQKLNKVVVVSETEPTDQNVSIWINPAESATTGSTSAEIAITTEAPTDDSVKIWINPESNG